MFNYFLKFRTERRHQNYFAFAVFVLLLTLAVVLLVPLGVRTSFVV